MKDFNATTNRAIIRARRERSTTTLRFHHQNTTKDCTNLLAIGKQGKAHQLFKIKLSNSPPGIGQLQTQLRSLCICSKDKPG